MNYKQLLPYLFAAAIGALIMYSILRPIDEISPLKPIATITQETEAKAQPIEDKIVKWEGEKQLIRDSVALLKSKWREAISENNRLMAKSKLIQISQELGIVNRPGIPDSSNWSNISSGSIDFIIGQKNFQTCAEGVGQPNFESSKNGVGGISLNGTAADYTEQLINTDSLCAETIGAMERQQLKTDSLYQAQKFISAVYKFGFENMKSAATAREEQIKQLNRKLKWQKVQATGLKVVAIAVAAIVIKNQLK